MVCDEWKDSSQFVNQAIVLNTLDMIDKNDKYGRAVLSLSENCLQVGDMFSFLRVKYQKLY